MGLITTTGSGNWSSTTPDAPWPGGTKPTTNDTVEIAAGHTVTLDEDTAALGANGIKNVAGSNTSVLVVSGARAINGNVSYSGTATTGMVTVGNGATVTVNGLVTNTGTGRAIVAAGTGIVTIANGTSTAISQTTAAGIAVHMNGGTGALSITGDISATTGYAVYNQSTSTAHALTGNILTPGGVFCYWLAAGTLAWTARTSGATTTASIQVTAGGQIGLYLSGNSVVNVTGDITTYELSHNTAKVAAIWTSYGTVNYIGAHSLGAGCELHFTASNAVAAAANLVFATAGSALALSNAGTFVVDCFLGTLTTTAAGGTATITQTSSSARAAVIGGTITTAGPTLPTAADVRKSSGGYGWNAATTPTLVGCVDFDGVNQGATGILNETSDFYADGVLAADGTYADLTYAHTTAGGSLTLPAATVVLKGSGAYGIDGDSETPTLERIGMARVHLGM